MEEQMQNDTQGKGTNHSWTTWIPHTAALVVLVPHVVAAMVNKNIWYAVGGQVLGLAVFVMARFAFPISTTH